MATHAVKFLKFADQIIIMKEGAIKVTGSYSVLRQNQLFIQTTLICEKLAEKEIREIEAQQQKYIKQQVIQKQQYEEANLQKKLSLQNGSKINHNQQNTLSQISQQDDLDRSPKDLAQKLLIQEQKQNGRIKLQTILTFIQLSGGLFQILIVIVLYLGWTVLSCFSNIIIQYWCQNLVDLNDRQKLDQLIMYVATSLGSTFTLFIGMLLVIRKSKIISTNSHSKTIDSLFEASLNKFFNRVPSGRVINRLSKDIGKIDQSLIDYMKLTLINLFLCLGNISMCIYASGFWGIIPMVPFVIGAFKIKTIYMKTKVQCTRFESLANSIVLDGLITGMNGASTIRAYGLIERFIENQVKKVDYLKRMAIGRQVVQGWFSVRMGLLTLLFNMPIFLIAIFNVSYGSAVIGLLMVYTLTLSDLVTDFVQYLAYFENQLVSVERINQFIKLTPQIECLDSEKYQENQVTEISESDNSIQFKSVSAKYLNNHPDILSQITFSVKKGEKIGIIGKTGAGKSTIFNILLRVIDPSQGKVLINGRDITQYSLKNLRQHILTTIDQQSVVFNSSFRQNLDPSGKIEDQQIIEMCNKTQIWDLIKSRGGLEGLICVQSLSVGQKQLISLSRALLKKSQIILIDEATANVDVKNESKIQIALREQLKEKTVLMIAHRLQTLSDCDKIMVLGNKRILQFGRPSELLMNDQSIYKQMIQTNNKEYII